MGKHTRKDITVRQPIRVSLVNILYGHSIYEWFHFRDELGDSDEKAGEMQYLS